MRVRVRVRVRIRARAHLGLVEGAALDARLLDALRAREVDEEELAWVRVRVRVRG